MNHLPQDAAALRAALADAGISVSSELLAHLATQYAILREDLDRLHLPASDGAKAAPR